MTGMTTIDRRPYGGKAALRKEAAALRLNLHGIIKGSTPEQQKIACQILQYLEETFKRWEDNMENSNNLYTLLSNLDEDIQLLRTDISTSLRDFYSDLLEMSCRLVDIQQRVKAGDLNGADTKQS